MPLDSYVYDNFSNLGANATLNVVVGNTKLLSFKCHNLNAASRYIQFHNTATVPASTNVPVISFLVPAASEIVIGNEYFGTGGMNFPLGLAFAFSTTEGTYTAGTASDQFTYVNYRTIV